MFRVNSGSTSVDLCPALIAKLFADGLLNVERARGTRERVTPAGRQPFILRSDVSSVTPVRALHAACDEHGSRCP